jgi:hypothetical protein
MISKHMGSVRVGIYARLRRQAGQSMVEYIVGLAILVAVVSVPVGGQSSLITFFLNAVQVAYQRFLVANSVTL